MTEFLFFLAGAAMFSALVWALSRRPKIKCPECGEELGSKVECESCVDWWNYP